MKNYYDQQMELATVLFRIATLQEKKSLYFDRTQPSSPKFGEKVSSSHKDSEPFLVYTQKIEDIDKELEELYEEATILEKYLKKMEDSLRKMKGILERIFVAKYIDGLNVKKLCIKFNYSKTQIYRYLQIIHSIVKDGKKWE